MAKQKAKAVDKGLSKALIPKAMVANKGVEIVEGGEAKKVISRMTLPPPQKPIVKSSSKS